MTRDELAQLLHDIANARIAVIGDYCLDAYWFIDPAGEEISIETGLPTRAVHTQRYSLGGAGNVVMNLHALGVRAIAAFGVIGDDPYGPHMLRLLRAHEVDTAGMLMQSESWATHVYTKPYLDDVEQNRIDFGNLNDLSDTMATALVQGLRERVGELDVVVVNEQVTSGIHRSELFQHLLQELIKECAATIFLLDSRHYSERYDGTIRKLNDHEAARLCGVTRADDGLMLDTDACAAARELSQRWGRPVVITRGARGCLVCDQGSLHDIPGRKARGQVDPVGAGDSMLAGIAAALAAGRTTRAAATLGNYAAGVTVQKLFQTGTASPDEIMAISVDRGNV
jgi:rfaE bifunctional protein kinase chain/domain